MADIRPLVWRGAFTDYWHIAAMWIRSSFAYPLSFWIMFVGGAVINGLEFAAIWIMFNSIDSLGGFGLAEIGLLYGATGFGIGVADLVVGSVERIGTKVRLGALDVMMTRPVPLLVQVCADEFAIRRLSRILQALVVFAWASWFVDWTPLRALVAVEMLVSGGVIFFCLFVSFSCIQFWTSESTEVANAFTYGGNTLTQYPLTIFPGNLVKALTFVLPLAFVNWYPCLYLLGRDDPFDLPSWLSFASPVAALALVAVTAICWRAGIRRYSSTGS